MFDHFGLVELRICVVQPEGGVGGSRGRGFARSRCHFELGDSPDPQTEAVHQPTMNQELAGGFTSVGLTPPDRPAGTGDRLNGGYPGRPDILMLVTILNRHSPPLTSMNHPATINSPSTINHQPAIAIADHCAWSMMVHGMAQVAGGLLEPPLRPPLRL